jgi:hypothetical protein
MATTDYSVMISWECGHRILVGADDMEELDYSMKKTLEFIRTRDDVNTFSIVIMTPFGNFPGKVDYEEDYDGDETGMHFRIHG